MMRLFSIVLVSLTCTACDLFDPTLYQDAETANVGLADSCTSDVPTMEVDPEFFRLDLATLGDSWNVDNCTEEGAAGNDGFFAIELDRNRRYHFHVNAIDAIDPVVYVVDSCDERVCERLAAAATCNSGTEHLSFRPPRDGTYFVGVDSADPGGGRVELLVVSPACGNGDKEHSEACDDGNNESGDGCDAVCRLEIDDGRTAREPNDDFASANHLIAGDGQTFSVRGNIESRCDPEVFAFTPAQTGALSVEVLDSSGDPCEGISPEQTLELEVFEGTESLARERVQGECPSLSGVELASQDATYHISLSSKAGDVAPLDYRLVLTVE